VQRELDAAQRAAADRDVEEDDWAAVAGDVRRNLVLPVLGRT